jgi:nicotinamide mononucleotide adenylyltransferase
MQTSIPIHETGFIHGRFQVLHNDHLKYLLAGKSLCRRLVVGITNPDPFSTGNEDADRKRSDPLANPLSCYERHLMLEAVLRHAGLKWEEFMIVPFPINFPERYRYYAPMDAVFFLTIYDDWGRRKHQYFQEMGLNTHVLWKVSKDHKGISANDVRARIASGQPWEHLVPPSVPALIKQWKLRERLQKLQFEDGAE